MISNKIHICIMGCGEIVRNAHAPSLQRLKDKVQFSFASRDRKKAREYTDKYGGVNAYQGVEEVLSDKTIDAVSITLPHDQHRDVAVACAKEKKHILLEKPMACSVKEADDIIKAAKKHKVKLAIAESHAYSRNIQKAKELIDAGEIGEFRLIITSQFVSGKPTDWRLDEKQMGGGALIDGGVHYINQFHQLAGPVKEVFSMQPPKTISEMQGEDTSLTLMKFTNGGVGQFNYSWTAHSKEPRMPVFQAHGTLGTIYDLDGLFLVKKGGDKQQIFLPQGQSEGYNWMMEDFLDSILNDHEPRMTGEMGKQDIAVALAAYQSAKTGKPVKINS